MNNSTNAAPYFEEFVKSIPDLYARPEATLKLLAPPQTLAAVLGFLGTIFGGFLSLKIQKWLSDHDNELQTYEKEVEVLNEILDDCRSQLDQWRNDPNFQEDAKELESFIQKTEDFLKKIKPSSKLEIMKQKIFCCRRKRKVRSQDSKEERERLEQIGKELTKGLNSKRSLEELVNSESKSQIPNQEGDAENKEDETQLSKAEEDPNQSVESIENQAQIRKKTKTENQSASIDQEPSLSEEKPQDIDQIQQKGVINTDHPYFDVGFDEHVIILIKDKVSDFMNFWDQGKEEVAEEIVNKASIKAIQALFPGQSDEWDKILAKKGKTVNGIKIKPLSDVEIRFGPLQLVPLEDLLRFADRYEKPRISPFINHLIGLIKEDVEHLHLNFAFAEEGKNNCFSVNKEVNCLFEGVRRMQKLTRLTVTSKGSMLSSLIEKPLYCMLAESCFSLSKLNRITLRLQGCKDSEGCFKTFNTEMNLARKKVPGANKQTINLDIISSIQSKSGAKYTKEQKYLHFIGGEDNSPANSLKPVSGKTIKLRFYYDNDDAQKKNKA